MAITEGLVYTEVQLWRQDITSVIFIPGTTQPSGAKPALEPSLLPSVYLLPAMECRLKGRADLRGPFIRELLLSPFVSSQDNLIQSQDDQHQLPNACLQLDLQTPASLPLPTSLFLFSISNRHAC